MGVTAHAQTIFDALSISENDYYGTARSMGMGNAMTALGSDLGSITFNPAGGAVAQYSQLVVTPGFSISSTKSGVDDMPLDSKQTSTRFSLPNIGVNFHFDTGRSFGIKAINFGFVANSVGNHHNSMICGANTATSYAGALASFASEKAYTQADLDAKFSSDSADWMCILGNKTGMIDLPLGSSNWLGVTEDYEGKDALGNDIVKANSVAMEYTQQTKGRKMDYILNFGMNISDVVFLGVNLGLQEYQYSLERRLEENALSGIAYQTRFHSLSQSYDYRASGIGVYGKFGIIVTPYKGLRLGAAITTPTGLNIKEDWTNSMVVNTYEDDSKDKIRNSRSTTPLSDYRYKVVSPFRFNVGAAYAFSKAILSVDYELVDYGQTRMREYYREDKDYMNELNKEIRGAIHEDGTSFLGMSHMVRAGIEIKPVDQIAVRAGYTLTTSGERYYENAIAKSVKADIHTASFSLGYDSPGSFFADIACRVKFKPAEYYKLYSDYLTTYYENAGTMIREDIDSPVATARQTLVNIVATIGWRF